MTGNNAEIKAHYLSLARKVVDLMCDKIKKSDTAFTFAVGGESGSGKSTLSMAIKSVLKEEGHHTFIFHLDDYFYLPPKDTHDKRLRDLSSVGPDEVNLNLLQEHMDKVKDGTKLLKKPLVSYRENQIYEVIAETKEVEVVIVEGTYALLLEGVDCKIFLQRNYKDTYENRVNRARDPIIPFYESVLEIEHNIVKSHTELADVLIDKDYRVKVRNEKFKESNYT